MICYVELTGPNSVQIRYNSQLKDYLVYYNPPSHCSFSLSLCTAVCSRFCNCVSLSVISEVHSLPIVVILSEVHSLPIVVNTLT